MRICKLLIAVLILAVCACTKIAVIPLTVEEIRPGIIQGYLPLNKIPNSLALLPPPPPVSSVAFIADKEAFSETRTLINTQRWAQSIKDANLHFPEAPQAFSCALDAPITQEAMPNLYMLMRRTMTDAGSATLAAKKHYMRVRPFVASKEKCCTPDWEAELVKDGSYPSDHTAIGWTWALILSEIAPERAEAILSRGYAYGQSRVICGVHWQSDVTAGRVLGAAVVAVLHSDPVFLAQLEAAKEELAGVRAKGLKPSGDCKAESTALGF
ncbi:MAG: acid phosphatase [Deltaproteobacteria bacterium HGW-Deltaproteobacteria-10]|nr:MAG: acid phosphatase [Deltaproteobacteria bacterium HGW-Deltaproteobacteria-10]